jgi:hypothetical protein
MFAMGTHLLTKLNFVSISRQIPDNALGSCVSFWTNCPMACKEHPAVKVNKRKVRKKSPALPSFLLPIQGCSLLGR